MSPDGTDVSRLTSTVANELGAAWSPRGDEIAFYRGQEDDYSGAVNLIGADGTGDTELAPNGIDPDWSPEGERIVFATATGLVAINATGSARTQITTTFSEERDSHPSWSPAADRIAFSRFTCGGVPPICHDYLAFVDPGGGPVQIGENGDGVEPDWQSLGALDPYPRPGGATPLRVPLVPAYGECTPATQNSNHVAPLALDSCSPPALESAELTMSDIGNGSGQFRYDVQKGNPGTAADEADVSMSAVASDVRSTDGTDYSGKVLFRAVMRLTDRANGFGGVSGTAADFDFSLPADCIPTLSPIGGSACGVSTSADTLVPAFIAEGKRTLISALSVDVLDAGADGSVSAADCPLKCGTGDERVFLRQGILAP
jgi:hypothetical protein